MQLGFKSNFDSGYNELFLNISVNDHFKQIIISNDWIL